MSGTDAIVIEGAREHNLRDVTVSIPKRAITVLTGVSGSGKSSLVFDTLYAEGQRRFVESLSTRARGILGQMERPAYDRIRGLTPTIAVQQRSAGANPRSTVGTLTEVHDYLRVLFARAGKQSCHRCGRAVHHTEPAIIVRELLSLPEGTRFQLLAPKASASASEDTAVLDDARRRGFVRVRVGDQILRLEDVEPLAEGQARDLALVIDRLAVKAGMEARLVDSVETALREGGGRAIAEIDGQAPRAFSEHPRCPDCDAALPALTPQLFSFNSPAGMCPECNGLGTSLAMDPARVVPDTSLTLRQGAIAAPGFLSAGKGGNWGSAILQAVADRSGFDLDTPFEELADSHRAAVLHGLPGEFEVHIVRGRGRGTLTMEWEGVLPALVRRLRSTSSEGAQKHYRAFLQQEPCTACGGHRLRPEALAVRVGGAHAGELGELPIRELSAWFRELELTGEAAVVAGDLRRELAARLSFLERVGVGYLSLSRPGPSLSGGEAQRIRLAGQLGSELSGVTYVLDEPTVGLHPSDIGRLVEVLRSLRDLGSTVVVVEHDRAVLEAADHVVDVGPGPGRLGGRIVYSGPLAGLMEAPDSLTGDHLAGRRGIELPARRRPTDGDALIVRGPTSRNLVGDDVRIPLGCLVAVTGVSGAGKSTLVDDVLHPALARRLHGSSLVPGPHRGLEGVEHLEKVVRVDQRGLGRSARSNAATYTKVLGAIRQLFAKLPEAKARGWGAGRFSLNVKGGRCEMCKGAGVRRIEMHFLPDVEVPCETCAGSRFNASTLEVRFKGLSIAEVLDLPCSAALEVLGAVPAIARILQTLCDVGLGYLALGQAASTLSGGEAQRVKLARELARPDAGRTLYLLDEPTTGLHPEDSRRLLGVLDRLVDAGNTVLIVEHDMDLVRSADWVIDLGPGSGEAGGRVTAAGSPEEVAATDDSPTGAHLRAALHRA